MTDSTPEGTRPTAAVVGAGLWLPGYPNLDAWMDGTEDPEVVKPVGQALNRTNRRRAGVLARAIADAAFQALEQSGADRSTIPCVVGSSIGEADAMIGLLDQMWRGTEEMSPMKFTVSVHNASSGLLSISNENQGYVTSLAADEDTPAMALLEGIGLVVERAQPVLVVCGDEAAPAKLDKDGTPWDLLAAAVVLAPPSKDHADAPRVSVHGAHGEGSPVDAAALPDGIAASPQAGFVDLLDALRRGDVGDVRLDRGSGRGYRARIERGAP